MYLKRDCSMKIVLMIVYSQQPVTTATVHHLHLHIW